MKLHTGYQEDSSCLRGRICSLWCLDLMANRIFQGCRIAGLVEEDLFGYTPCMYLIYKYFLGKLDMCFRSYPKLRKVSCSLDTNTRTRGNQRWAVRRCQMLRKMQAHLLHC